MQRSWSFAVLACVWGGCSKAEHGPAREQLPPVATRPGPEVTAARRPTSALPAASVASEIGTAHPTLLTAAAADGGWVVVCQARADTDGDGKIATTVGYHGDLGGDEMRPYLVRGGGEGMAIDALVAYSQEGRWLVVERRGGLELIDVQRGETTALSDADTRVDAQLGPPRAATFTADNRAVVYFRGTSVVVRQLDTGDEREVSVAPGLPWRVTPTPSEPWVSVAVIRHDTDGNGQLEWPRTMTNAPTGVACRGPAMSYSTYGQEGDRPERIWLRVDTGEVVDDPSVAMPLPTGFVRRTPDGALVHERTVLVPRGCSPEVFAVIAAPLRVVALCDGGPAGKGPIELMGEGLRVKLEFPPAVIDDEGVYLADGELVCSTPDVCVRTRDGRPFDLGDSSVELRRDRRILVETMRDAFAVVDLATGVRTPLPGVSGYAHALAGSMVAVGEHVIDLATGRVVGATPSWPAAIDTQGRALIAHAGDGASGVMTGPLRWVPPTP